MNNLFSAADLIATYTRADAIADGELVDVGQLAREAGFTVPVALTRAVWADCVEWIDEDSNRKGAHQDQTGRLWDVLTMAHLAARRAQRGQFRVLFQLYRVPRQGRGIKPRLVSLALHIGGGDSGEPVITIMEPGED